MMGSQYGVEAPQVWQALPSLPQAPLVSPYSQIPLLQQPTLHAVWLASPQACSHVPVAVLQEVRTGQSLAEAQPHTPLTQAGCRELLQPDEQYPPLAQFAAVAATQVLPL
jgi:hypothetical protein